MKKAPTMSRAIVASLIAVLPYVLAFVSHIAYAQDSDPALAPDPWRNFKYPAIVIIDKDKGETEGAALVHKLVPDLENFIQEISLGVAKSLYQTSEEVPAFEKLTFVLEHYDGIAGKSGQPPHIKIALSTKYLEGQQRRLGDEAITYEIAGVNWHELTHAYQHVPRNAGGYHRGTDHFGFIEGTADAVRVLSGFHKTREPRPGGHWNDGYTTTGFFVAWVVKNRDSEFLYKLNQSCKTIDPWNWDSACRSIFGEELGVSQLWDEYQWHLRGGGKKAVAKFLPESQVICKGESIEFINRSFNGPTSYEWTFEAGTPATNTQRSPVVCYDKPGKHSVALVAINEHGETTKRVDSCVHVLDRTGNVLSLAELGGTISYDLEIPAMPGEGVSNLLDQDPRSKFCIKANTIQIQYVAPNSFEMYSYAFTSANDAPGRDPEDWTLEASNDGSEWTIVDRKEHQRFENRYETKPFVVDCRTAYKRYRWSLETRSDEIFQIADIEMLGVQEE